MLKLVLVILLLYIFLKKPCSEQKKDLKGIRNEPIKDNDSEDMVFMRANNKVLIQNWITQNNQDGRKKIVYWEFNKGNPNEIIFKFEKGKVLNIGKVHYKRKGIDAKFPRVSQVEYYDARGKRHTLRGYIPNEFAEKTLVNGFLSDSLSTEKLKYTNKIAQTAFRDGEAFFNILDYFGITEDEFKNTFSKKEIKSLRKVLLNDFKTVEPVDAAPHILRVTLQDIPES